MLRMKVVEHQFETKSRAKRDSTAESFSRCLVCSADVATSSLLSGVAGSSLVFEKQTAVAAETNVCVASWGTTNNGRSRSAVVCRWVWCTRPKVTESAHKGVVAGAQSKRQGEPLLDGEWEVAKSSWRPRA